MGHRAVWVGLEYRTEGVPPLLEPEGMEPGHCALEAAMGLGRARHGKADPAEPANAVVVGVNFLRDCCRNAGERRERDKRTGKSVQPDLPGA